ncbi:olxA [Rosenbergiella epipactidis]|uniref:olxA n=1 Tax=Rosenbergiella epipactidis TaxID=1544694 RepID=UPI001F4D3DD8|nr:olxA [Rosenbergiella epipactidis]
MGKLVETVIPQESYLNDILKDILSSGISEKDYVKNAISNIKQMIILDPRRYIAYGPWWPAIKQLIVGSGEVGIGQNIESDVAAIYSYPKNALTVLAGIIYSTERLEDHIVDDPYHYLNVSEISDDTEPYLYVSDDISISKYHLPN